MARLDNSNGIEPTENDGTSKQCLRQPGMTCWQKSKCREASGHAKLRHCRKQNDSPFCIKIGQMIWQWSGCKFDGNANDGWKCSGKACILYSKSKYLKIHLKTWIVSTYFVEVCRSVLNGLRKRARGKGLDIKLGFNVKGYFRRQQAWPSKCLDIVSPELDGDSILIDRIP